MLNKFYQKLCRIWRENQVFQYGSVWKKSVWQTDFQLAGSYLHRPTNALPSHLCQSTPSTVKQCLKFCGSNPCLKRHPSPFPRQRVRAHQNGVKKWCFFLVFKELPAFHFSPFSQLLKSHISIFMKLDFFSSTSALSLFMLAYMPATDQSCTI